jgi:uncharacterized protein with HEPN domain
MDRTPAFVADIIDASRELVSLVDGVSLEAFLADRLRCLAVEKLFINMGEACKRIDPERAAAIPGVPWGRMIGLRNILAHGYEQIEHEVLYRIITTALPGVSLALETWLAAQPGP